MPQAVTQREACPKPVPLALPPCPCPCPCRRLAASAPPLQKRLSPGAPHSGSRQPPANERPQRARGRAGGRARTCRGRGSGRAGRGRAVTRAPRGVNSALAAARPTAACGPSGLRRSGGRRDKRGEAGAPWRSGPQGLRPQPGAVGGDGGTKKSPRSLSGREQPPPAALRG